MFTKFTATDAVVVSSNVITTNPQVKTNQYQFLHSLSISRTKSSQVQLKKGKIREVPEIPFLHGDKLSLGQHPALFSFLWPREVATETGWTNGPEHFCWAYTHKSATAGSLFHHPQHSSPTI